MYSVYIYKEEENIFVASLSPCAMTSKPSEKKHDSNFFPLPNKSNRCKYNVSSVTTYLQNQTEDECCPFFVDIPSLPKSQLDHLRQVGLLPPIERVRYNHEEEIIDMTTLLNASDGSISIDTEPKKFKGRADSEDDWDTFRANLSQRDLKEYNSVQRTGGPMLQRAESRVSTIASISSDNSSKRDREIVNDPHQYDICLLRSKHTVYCYNALTKPLPASYFSLDASRPWMIYWNLHSLDLLNALPEPHVLINIVKQLGLCWEEFPINGKKDDEQQMAGGYGGGPGQMAHCATTYAAVLALCIIAGCNDDRKKKDIKSSETSEPTYEDAAKLAQSSLLSIRSKLYRFFHTLRTPANLSSTSDKNANNKSNPVGFSMHLDGESDVRGTYTVIAISYLLHILTPELVQDVPEYIIACQTYEGGFGGEPMGTEAHGGYTFCAVAALNILRKLKDVEDKPNLLGWLARRQMEYEGGFSGRSNKLVDGCYSFWIGGSSALMMMSGYANNYSTDGSIMHEMALERYILLCGQCVDGGLRDKPSKNRDFYHTCYCLSGLSTAQHFVQSDDLKKKGDKATQNSNIYGHPSNILEKIDPSFNIGVKRVENVMSFFTKNGIHIDRNGFSGRHTEMYSLK